MKAILLCMLLVSPAYSSSNEVVIALRELVAGTHAYRVIQTKHIPKDAYEHSRKAKINSARVRHNFLQERFKAVERVISQPYRPIVTNTVYLCYHLDPDAPLLHVADNYTVYNGEKVWRYYGSATNGWSFLNLSGTSQLELREGAIPLNLPVFRWLVYLQSLQSVTSFTTKSLDHGMYFEFDATYTKHQYPIQVCGHLDRSKKLSHLFYSSEKFGQRFFEIKIRNREILYSKILSSGTRIEEICTPVDIGSVPELMTWEKVSQFPHLEIVSVVSGAGVPQVASPIGPPPRTYDLDPIFESPFPALFPEFARPVTK